MCLIITYPDGGNRAITRRLISNSLPPSDHDRGHASAAPRSPRTTIQNTRTPRGYASRSSVRPTTDDLVPPRSGHLVRGGINETTAVDVSYPRRIRIEYNKCSSGRLTRTVTTPPPWVYATNLPRCRPGAFSAHGEENK